MRRWRTAYKLVSDYGYGYQSWWVSSPARFTYPGPGHDWLCPRRHTAALVFGSLRSLLGFTDAAAPYSRVLELRVPASCRYPRFQRMDRAGGILCRPSGRPHWPVGTLAVREMHIVREVPRKELEEVNSLAT